MDFFTSALILSLGFSGMCLGIYITLKIFNIPDITTDGSYTLGGAVTAVLLTAQVHPVASLFIVLGCGALAGMLTGIIHTQLKVNALLSGILVMTALYSVNLIIMGRSNIPLLEVSTIFSVFDIGQNVFQNELIVMIIFSVAMVLFLSWLLKTDFGIAMRATGNSENMVRAMGVNTQRMKITGLALANALTALSGYLVTQYQAFADINMGIGIVISGLGSVMIGQALAGFVKSESVFVNIVFVIIGAIAFRLILAAALAMGLNPNYLKLVTAAIVLLVVSVSYFSNRRKDD